MFNFFKCNCSSFVDGLETPNALVYIDNITLQDVDSDKIVQMMLELTIILEGCRLNKKQDSLYLLDLSKPIQNMHSFDKIEGCFHIPFTEQDDSSQQMSVKVSISVYPGVYKLYYLRTQEQIKQKGEYIYGDFEIIGASSHLKVDYINQNQVKFQSPMISKVENSTHLRDVTNISQFGIRQGTNSDYMNSIEDEKPNTKQFGHLAPKLKRKY